MNKLFHAGLAIFVVSLLTTLGWARQGRSEHGTAKAPAHARMSSPRSSKASARSNRSGKVRGLERAEGVQEMNKRADAERGFTVAPGVEKAEKHQAGEKAGKAGKKGKTRKGNAEGTDEPKDRN